MRRLPDEIDAAAHEIECLKAALSCSTNDGESYLGMRGDIEKDRPVLCSLLQLAMQALDRLREKEIEVLKATSAAAAATGKCARSGENRVSTLACPSPALLSQRCSLGDCDCGSNGFRILRTNFICKNTSLNYSFCRARSSQNAMVPRTHTSPE